MAVPDKAKATGPWDNRALGSFASGNRCGSISASRVRRPVDRRRLPRKDVELISLAVNAACTNLSAEEPGATFAAHSTRARHAKRF